MSNLRRKVVAASGFAVVGAAGLFGLAALMNAAGIDPEADAKRALESSGYSEITTEYSANTTMLKCGEDDNFGYDFTAKNPAGKVVSGHVCTGVLKGATIRF